MSQQASLLHCAATEPHSPARLRNVLRTALCWFAAVLMLPALVSAQVIIIPPHPPRPPIPPRPPRPIPQPIPPRAPSYKIDQVDVHALVKDQIAKVQIAQEFRNTDSRTIEAQFLFPLPPGAAVSELTLLVDGKEMPGKLMKKEEARRIYEEIVRRQRDPALLEYLGRGLFQTSVFPIPPNQKRRVEIRYSQLLSAQDGLIDLVLPVGTNRHSGRPVEKLQIDVRIESSSPVKTVYSPSHSLQIERPDEHRAVCKLTLHKVSQPDDVRIMYGARGGLIGANVISYRPNESEDGYFMLLSAPDIKAVDAAPPSKTIVFVLDRSGSMNGEKIAQAREALKYVLERLTRPGDGAAGDLFNIVAYDSDVETFQPELQRADEKTIQRAIGFVDGIHAGGSTNIDAALKTALGMLHDKAGPNYVVFLTDGLPTVGERNEVRITENSQRANEVRARLFAFGVGFDVNSRLLDRLARTHRGLSLYVRPNENIEEHVSRLYNRIAAPVMVDVAIRFEFDKPASESSPSAISRTYPRQLPDLFRGEQLVLVGRYRQAGTAKVTISGLVSGREQKFSFPATFAPVSRDETNGFVEKVWAVRRIGEIIDELDLHGQNQELIDELVQLSLKHGILTPYTSFLAEEDAVARDSRELRRRASASAANELSKTEGAAGFAQRALKGKLQAADRAPAPTAAAPAGRPGGLGGALPTNANAPVPAFEAKELESYTKAQQQAQRTIRQIGQKTFYRRGNLWQDSTVKADQEKNAVRIKQFSREYFDLAAKHQGQFAKYLAFTEPVLIELDGKPYLIEP